MESNVPVYLKIDTKQLRYAFRRGVAMFMRKEGFKFHPVLRDELQECLTRVDYRFCLNFADGRLKIDITIN